jgi:bifunctional UDP-N-acetylglucosamine pyrophosphorylase/glucosamine-1-phosphate N-acetyltransferase
MAVNGPVAIILAAGQGKRMKSDKAKVLHEVCGRPMIGYVVDAARGAGARTIVVVVGYASDQVLETLRGEPDIVFAHQTEQLGTGHAVKICRPLLEGYRGPALILVGDEPLLRPQPLADLLARQEHEDAACLLGTAKVHDPMGFGRILRDSAGRFLRIVEERDCTPEEKAIREVNPSCYVFELPVLWDALDQIGTSNAQHEYYLTDAPERLMTMGRKVMALNVLRPDDILGVNTRQHLAHAASVMQARIQDHWMTEGVTIDDPHNTYIDGRATIGRDTVIHPFTVISGNVTIGAHCRVGPFTHLRPGTVLDDGVEAGAFVEIKDSHLQSGTVARHLAYLGNATVGRDVNIGAGSITANFDGIRKNNTEIGDRASVGSGAIMVAPVTIGQDAVVGAGAVITRGTRIEDGETVVGVPARPLAEKQDAR